MHSLCLVIIIKICEKIYIYWVCGIFVKKTPAPTHYALCHLITPHLL